MCDYCRARLATTNRRRLNPLPQAGRLDWPQYALTGATNVNIPEALTCGDHASSARWRIKQALARTWMRRPDLLARVKLSPEERAMIDEITLQSMA